MSVTRIWRNAAPWHVEFADVAFEGEALQASGVAIGAEPMAYRLEYELSTSGGSTSAGSATGGYLTRRLAVTSSGAGWRRAIVLERSDAGAWSCRAEAHGEVDVPRPGGDLSTLEGALDCDLGLSPLTNSMPLLRHRLHQEPGSVEFLMAWVAVPELTVYPSRQRYTHVRRTDNGTGAVVHFESLDSDFTADITFDAHGLVVDYPGIGQVVATTVESTP